MISLMKRRSIFGFVFNAIDAVLTERGDTEYLCAVAIRQSAIKKKKLIIAK
jgi:hypothetical protein